MRSAPFRFILLPIVTAAMLLLVALSGPGQGASAAPNALQLTRPDAAGEVAAEGDDFFTSVIGDPLEFDTPEDVIWPDGWSRHGMSGGVWSGTTARTDSNFFLLFPGYDIGANGVDMRNGEVYQIDPTRYSRLVFKYTASADTGAVVYWLSPGDPYRRNIGNSDIYSLAAGTHIVEIDLARRGVNGSGGVAWTSERWGGLRLSPAFGTPGVSVQLDWVRLVPAGGGPTVRASWTCATCNSSSLDFYADLDNNAGNGGLIKLAGGVSISAAQQDVPVGKLGPGNYFLAAGAPGQTPIYSAGPFTVRAAPLIKLTAPSTSSGEDFATSMLGKPWDMTSRAALGPTLNITNFTVAGGIAQGTGAGDDPVINLLDLSYLPGAPVINTARFKYLNFDLYLERPGFSNFNVARVLWYNSPAQSNATHDIINWHNYWHRYSLDLSKVKMAYRTEGWTGTQSVLRIDPHETDLCCGNPPFFKLGPVKLTGDPSVAQGGTTSITWEVLRGGGTVALYYDSARSYSGTQIAANIPLSSGGYRWSVGSLPVGSYWIRAVVSDGANTTQFYGNAPLVVTPAGPVGIVAMSEPNGVGDAAAEGDDFFTQQLRDAADFRNGEDVSEPFGWASQGMSNGVWSGTSQAPDAHFFLLYPGYDGMPASGRGQQVQVDPNRYSRLVFKYTVSAPTGAIVHYMSPGDPYRRTLGNSDIYHLQAGTHIVEIDLNKRGSGAGGALWTAERWGGLRLAPAFGTPGVSVDLHWVRLVPANAGPRLSTTWSCVSCTSTTVDFYADIDNNAGNGGMALLAAGVSTAGGRADVPVGMLAGGEYYLAAVAPGNPVTYSPGKFSVTAAAGYGDVTAADPFYSYINNLAARGIVDGYPDNTFRSFEHATRGTLARWMVKARGWSFDTTGGPHFSDVPAGHPDYAYIETAFNKGVISGYDDRTFRPANTLTRGQMSKMVVKAMGWAHNTSMGPHFVDVTAANPFYEQIETIYNRTVVSGYDLPGGLREFRWGNPLTRGQLAKVLAIAIGP